MHREYVHVHPAALAMAACMGDLVHSTGGVATGTVRQVPSLPYMIRMRLFDFLRLDPGRTIEEHEEAGRFIPITKITNNDELRNVITNMIPLLHAPEEVADPIQYVVSEMVRNVLEHAASPVGAFICAQYYRDLGRLSIGIADAGVGIRNSMARSHKVTSSREAILLALQPGVTGVTARIGGNESNAGAGLFFTRSIAALSGNYFFLHSGPAMFKLLRPRRPGERELNADPSDDDHTMTTDLPNWAGTVVGIDISVKGGRRFGVLLDEIRKSYTLDTKTKKKAYYRRIRFVS
jgi:anti-sigma regulatory factor (Ser/Thr protein kinase)